MGTPLVVRDVVEDVAEDGHVDLPGRVGTHDRAVDDLGRRAARGERGPQGGAGLDRVDGTGPFQKHARQVARAGTPVDCSRVGRNVDEQAAE